MRYVVFFALTMCNIGWSAFRVDRILQVPLDRAQTVNSLTADRSGNLIVTGSNVQGGFVSKLDSQGNLVFSFANFGSFPAAAAVDANGDVYWIGSAGFSFPFTKKILPVADRGSKSAGFVVKFRGTDGAIIWAAQLEALQPQAIALDAAGQITLAGLATTAPMAGIARLTADGDAVFMATHGGHTINGVSTCVSGEWFGCASDPTTSVSSVLLDSQGHIWVAGFTNEIDLPVSPNAVKTVCGCGLTFGDGYLAELSADGAKLLYSTYIGTSTGNDVIRSAAIDASGRIWLAGSADQDGFVQAYDPTSNKVSDAIYFGTEGMNEITRIAIDPDGRPVVAGHLNSNRFNPYSFGTDFMAVLEPSGIETTAFLHNGADAGIAFSPSGSLIVAGSRSVIAVLSESSAVSPSIFGVANAASLQATGQVSSGEIISMIGSNFGSGAEVLFDGVRAPLLYTSETQINAIVPFGVADRRETRMVVKSAGVTSNEARLGVVPASPAIFMTKDVLQYLPVAAAINQDGTINSSSNPAAPGSIVSIFGTGFGALTPAPVDGSIVGAPLPALQQSVGMFGPGFVDVLYAGPAPGQAAGVTQINFRVEREFGGPPTLLLYSGGWAADAFTVWVR